MDMTFNKNHVYFLRKLKVVKKKQVSASTFRKWTFILRRSKGESKTFFFRMDKQFSSCLMFSR